MSRTAEVREAEKAKQNKTATVPGSLLIMSPPLPCGTGVCPVGSGPSPREPSSFLPLCRDEAIPPAILMQRRARFQGVALGVEGSHGIDIGQVARARRGSLSTAGEDTRRSPVCSRESLERPRLILILAQE